MEHILIWVLSVLLIVDATLVFYWMNKCNTYRRTISTILGNQRSVWGNLLALEMKNHELEAKLKELKEGAE